jgi:site-specific DNA-cytosine methylase
MVVMDCGVEITGPLSARDYKDPGTDGLNKISAKMIPVINPTFALQGAGATSQSSQGSGWNEEVQFTLNTLDVHGVAQPISVQAYENHPSDSRVKELGDISSTVRARWGTGGGNAPMVSQPMVWDTTNITSPQNGSNPKPGDPCFTLAKGQHPPLLTSMAVRRLTPVECERLQGFPDNYTNIPWRKAAESPDGPRYKALGNSWAVPVVAWIGQRIQNQIK